MRTFVGERKSGGWGRILQTIILLSISLLWAGCATTSKTAALPRVIHTESAPDVAKVDFGRIGVIMPSVDTLLDLQLPATRKEVFSKTTSKTYKAMSDDPDDSPTVDDSDDSIGDEMAFFAFKATFSIISGLTHSMMSGTSEAHLKHYEAAVRKARDEALASARFQSNLVALAQSTPGKSIVFIPASYAENQPLDFCSLAAYDIDTVMTVRLGNEKFYGGSAANTALSYAMDAEVELLRVSDGAVLYSDHLTYQSKPRHLSKWAEEGGRRTRAEVETAQRFLSRDVFKDYLAER